MTLSGAPVHPDACQAVKNSPAISGATNQSRWQGCGISPACNASSAPRQRSAGRASVALFRCLADSLDIDEAIQAVEVEAIGGGVDALDVVAECRILDEHRPSPFRSRPRANPPARLP